MRIARLKTSISLTLVFGVVLAAVPAPARAGDDNVPIDTKIFRSVMKALGFKGPHDTNIEYQERAPLVIPPDNNLPPPQARGAAVASNPNWPKDPDIARAKIAATRSKDYATTEQIEHEENPLSPHELAPGHSRQTAIQGPDNSQPTTYGEGGPMSPKELGFKGSLFGTLFAKDKPETAKFTGEPRRTSLTQQPPGYQVPSPDQPYGIGKEASKPKADNSYINKGELSGE
jgi:hypothetical protein